MSKAWDVYKNRDANTCGDIIDTVFYDDDCDAQWVYDGLVNHDGYDPAIMVHCNETGEHYPEER